ncbi:MAG: hypothetical protein JRF53_00465 [Deltaproteobacteria bacterium]|nr:hypothetical protein [Deltaproteobacteria bacterium]
MATDDDKPTIDTNPPVKEFSALQVEEDDPYLEKILEIVRPVLNRLAEMFFPFRRRAPISLKDIADKSAQDTMIKIETGDLEPELKAFMWKLVKKIETRGGGI